MLESPRPCGASRSLDDPTVAMQRIIDQAMDLVSPTGALTSQDEAALARLTTFISTVAGVRELDVPYGQGYFLSRPTRPQLIPDSYAHVAARAAMSAC